MTTGTGTEITTEVRKGVPLNTPKCFCGEVVESDKPLISVAVHTTSL